MTPFAELLETARVFANKKASAGWLHFIVSGRIGEDIALETMKAGANDYILKDNLVRLIPAVERDLGDVEVRKARKRAEMKLVQAYAELEKSVQERTIELQ